MSGPVRDVHGRPRKNIPTSTHALLAERPELSRADHHLFAILMSFVNAGHTEVDAWSVLLDDGVRGGLALQRRYIQSAGKSRAWFHRQWLAAECKVAARPAVGDEFALQADIARIEHAVRDRQDLWVGVAGASRRAVILAIIYFARLAKNTTLRVSERQIAAHMQAQQRTVHAALQWHLEHGPFLRRVANGGGVKAAIYTLTYDGVVQGHISSSPSGGVIGTDVLLQPVADAFSRAGLGPNAQRLLEYLPAAPGEARSSSMPTKSPAGDEVALEDSGVTEDDPAMPLGRRSHVPGLCSGRGACTCAHVVRTERLAAGLHVHELMEATGLHVSTVRRQLARMSSMDLIAADAEGRLAKLAVSDAALGARLGVMGRGEARRAGFEAERDAWWAREAGKQGCALVDAGAEVLIVNVKTGEVFNRRTRRAAPANEQHIA